MDELVIFWKEKPFNVKNYAVVGGEDKFSKVDILKTSPKLPLLFARLAYVFEIYDESLKDSEEFEDFVEIVLNSVRIKKTLKEHLTTLEEVAGLLYLIDNAKKVSLVIGDVSEEEMENLMSFVKMFGKKFEIVSKKPFEVKFYGI